MQLIYWCMNKITPEKYRTIIYLILTAVIMIWNEEIKSYPTIFMFNNAVQWLPYFIIGNLFGLKLSRLILDYQSFFFTFLSCETGFSIKAQSAGDSVKAFTPEMTIATASVNEN